MSSRPRLTALLAVTTALVVVFTAFIATPAGAAGKPPGLASGDAAYYADVGPLVPQSFHRLGSQEIAALAGADVSDPGFAGYRSDDPPAALFVHVTIGKGQTARAVFLDDLRRADQRFQTEDLIGFLADDEIPADQVSVTGGEWTDLAVGDAARTATYRLQVADETVHFEVLSMVVGRDADAARVDLAHAFAGAPSVDTVDLARSVAARIRAGRPSPEEVIATTGFVTAADLPPGWQQAANDSTVNRGGSGSQTGGHQPGNDAADEVLRIARKIPACRAFTGLAGSGSGTVGSVTSRSPRGTDRIAFDGPKFTLGSAAATSQVTVFPTATVADEVFRLGREPTTKTCLTRLYRTVVTEALQKAGKKLSPAQRRELRHVVVEVTTPKPPSVGDDVVLFRITVDLGPVSNVKLVVEQEFVRVGRAVGTYTFSTVGDGSIRENVVRSATNRLAAAPGVR